jgi:hypothetical protein
VTSLLAVGPAGRAYDSNNRSRTICAFETPRSCALTSISLASASGIRTFIFLMRVLYDEVGAGTTDLANASRADIADADYLVAWVPPEFLELANSGLDANPERCIQWLDMLDNPFVQSLTRLKLIK